MVAKSLQIRLLLRCVKCQTKQSTFQQLWDVERTKDVKFYTSLKEQNILRSFSFQRIFSFIYLFIQIFNATRQGSAHTRTKITTKLLPPLLLPQFFIDMSVA